MGGTFYNGRLPLMFFDPMFFPKWETASGGILFSDLSVHPMVYLKTGNATGSKEFSRRAAGKNFSLICNIPPPWAVFYVKGGADMKQTEAPERQGRMTPEGLARSYERNVDTVWNVCITFLKNPADAEDAVQETFLRLLRSAPELGSETHEKAWLIVTARNVCKNELARARRREVPLEEAPAHYVPELSDTLLALRSLPEKYRLPLYLYYYEGYSTAETAEMLGKPAATVRSDLRRGRERMKALLGGDF